MTMTKQGDKVMTSVPKSKRHAAGVILRHYHETCFF